MRVRFAVAGVLFVSLIGLSSAGLSHARGLQPPAGQAAPAVTGLPTAPDQTFVSGEVTLRYREVGQGPPILLVHGYTGSVAAWFGFAGPLASTHRVIAVDVRGFGQSSKFGDPKRFGEPMADDLIRLLDSLKIDRAHVIGHSMGALIAANVVARYPTRVSSATLVAGPFYPDRATFARESAPWIADLEGGQGLTKFFSWLFPAMDPKTAAFASAQAMKSNDLPSLIAVLRALPDLIVPPAKALSVPTLVAVGTVDPLQPLSVALVAGSKAKLVEVKDADHITILRSPEVHKALGELLQGQAVTSGVANPPA
jgi:pimeloyl-ACP methyl ester carboxylesterase